MTLLIVHIPKTGGISLQKLVRHFNPDTEFAYGGQLRVSKPDLDYAKRFRDRPTPRVVMGHFSYGVHRWLGLAPAYVTVLREPIRRVVSQYRYEKSKSHSVYREYFDAGISLRDFVGNEVTELTNNYMCRVIAGIPPEAGMVLTDRWLLDLAIHNLRRHFILAGTLENYAAFLSSLAARLNWGPFDIPQENITEGPAVELDRETREVIVELNSLDIALFDYVNREYYQGVVGRGS